MVISNKQLDRSNLKQKTKKGVYWTFGNQFITLGMNFIVGIILARLLSPSDFGIAALPAVFIEVARVFTDAGFSGAMIRKVDLTEEDITTAFYYSVIAGVLAYIILFFAAPYIADFYNVPILTPLIRVSTLSFLWGPLCTPQIVILNRRLDFKTPTQISVVSSVFSAVVGITIAYMGYGIWALVLSSVLSSLSTLVLTCFAVRWRPRAGWSRDSFKYLWGYGNKMMASRLIDRLYSNIVPIFVGKFYSPADLGVYNRAQHYAELPSKNATNVLQQVTFPVLSKMQENDDVLSNNYRRIIKASAFVIFPVMLMLSALARPLIIVMITEKWESSILLLQLMCFSMMWYPIHAINLNLLTVKGRSDLFLKSEIIKKSYGLVALAITLPISLVAVVLSRWVTNVLSLIVNTYYTKKLLNYGFWQQMRDLIPIFLLSLVMWGAIHVVNMFVVNYVLQILVGGLVGVIIYIGLAFLLRFPELEDVKYMIKIKS